MSVASAGGVVDLTLVAGRDYPNTYREFVAMFPDDRASATYISPIALAGRIYLPVVQGRFDSLEPKPWPIGMPCLPSPNVCHGGHDLRQDTHPADDVVRGRLAYDHGHERSVGQDAGAHVGDSLSSGVDDATAFPHSDGGR